MTDKLILWHPLLFAIISVIMPFTQYAGLIPPSQIVAPFIVICTFSLLLYFIIKRMVKKTDVAVTVLSPLLYLFFSYGILHNYISLLTAGKYFNLPVLILMMVVILIILVVYIVKVLRAHEGTIRYVNGAIFAIACGLIIFNVFSITMRSIATAKVIESSRMTGSTPQKHTGPLPDIYFVILDEYAAPSQMKSYFQYDMSPFVEYLSQKGFMVTEMYTESLTTGAIIENRLNMAVINSYDAAAAVQGSLTGRLSESMNIANTRDDEQMIHIRNSKVMGYLKGIGYQYIHLGSWFTATRYNQIADQNINFSGVHFTNELSNIIVRGSFLRLLINRYTVMSSDFFRKEVLSAFATLENIPIVAGKPKFIFAHIICPHTPYVFGPNGEKLGLQPGEDWKNNKEFFLGQHIFITKKIKELVEHKLSSSQAAPVIIIQADHGARLDKPQAHQVFSAVYVPNYKGAPWPASTNSINTFKFLFNDLFGTKFPI